MPVGATSKKQTREARLGGRGEQTRSEQAQRISVVAAVERAVAQDRVVAARDGAHAIVDPDGARDGVQVPVAARDELRAAIEHERAVPLAAHAAARLALAFENLDVVARAAQAPGAGEPRDATAHHRDRCHAAPCPAPGRARARTRRRIPGRPVRGA